MIDGCAAFGISVPQADPKVFIEPPPAVLCLAVPEMPQSDVPDFSLRVQNCINLSKVF
jgi:hypothetical protein